MQLNILYINKTYIKKYFPLSYFTYFTVSFANMQNKLFSFSAHLLKWNFTLKSNNWLLILDSKNCNQAFCMYSGYLSLVLKCLILKLTWWSERFQIAKYAKKQQLRTQEGGMLLLDAVSNQWAYFNQSYNSVKFNNNIKLNIVILYYCLVQMLTNTVCSLCPPTNCGSPHFGTLISPDKTTLCSFLPYIRFLLVSHLVFSISLSAALFPLFTLLFSPTSSPLSPSLPLYASTLLPQLPCWAELPLSTFAWRLTVFSWVKQPYTVQTSVSGLDFRVAREN